MPEFSGGGRRGKIRSSAPHPPCGSRRTTRWALNGTPERSLRGSFASRPVKSGKRIRLPDVGYESPGAIVRGAGEPLTRSRSEHLRALAEGTASGRAVPAPGPTRRGLRSRGAARWRSWRGSPRRRPRRPLMRGEVHDPRAGSWGVAGMRVFSTRTTSPASADDRMAERSGRARAVAARARALPGAL